MTVNDRKVFVMALMLVALMSIFVSVASAEPGTQKWYPHPPGDCSNCLTKTVPGLGHHTIADGAYMRWHTNAARCDLTMGAGTWVLYIDYLAPCAGQIDVKVLNKETEEVLNYRNGIAVIDCEEIRQKLTVDIDADPKSVFFNDGNHLQLEIKWIPDTGGEALKVYCGTGDTTISSPPTDPGYPVPELSTLALFSVGLLALVGYVGYRRRRI